MLALLVMFGLSGAAGLIDQLCFSKYLQTIVGSTAHAVSAVLAAFMTGLALGAHFGGKLSCTIARPLRAYGVAEALVAGTVLATPFAFGVLGSAYVALAHALPDSGAWLDGLRWSVAVLLVLVPTLAMGATLPLLSKAIAYQAAGARAREHGLAKLYAVNTLGGALGALGTAYWVLPALGLTTTLVGAAALSALVGAVAMVLDGRERMARPQSAFRRRVASGGTDHEHSTPTRGPKAQSRAGDGLAQREVVLLAVLAFGSGALVFTAEVVFTHLLSLIIGNSVYAFGLILAIFLCCLFLGAWLAPRVQSSLGDAALPLSMAATALALVIALPVWDKLPLLFNNTGRFITSFGGREAVRGIAAFTVLLVPTTAMGLTFPLLLQRVAAHSRVGLFVGRLTAINTVGAVVGSLVAGYLLLPELGSEHSLVFIAACFGVAAAYACWALAQRWKLVGWLAGTAAALAVILPGWDLSRLTAGTNVYFDGAQPTDELLMLREDVQGGVTSVAEANGVRTLYTNGKFQGNTGWEMNAQRYFAHYPSLFVPRFEQALVIGLGTGTTAGTLATYPWKRIEIAEISPAIAEAASTYFGDVNHHVLSDPRVDLVFADGRNHLMLTEQRYDLISIELSSIWFAGAASLYSSEFYDLVVDHLSEGGILQQWVQLHHITPRCFATLLGTVRAHFAHLALFYGGGQGVLVASQKPLRASEQRALRLESKPRISATLPEVRTQRGTKRRRLYSLVGDVLLMNQDLDRYLQETAAKAGEPVGSLVSTDDNLYLEYATPRGNVLPWSAREDLVRELTRFRTQAVTARLRSD